MKIKIKNIKGREILDSRGIPTVEVELETETGIFKSSVPSGTSTGKYEALELRDGGERYNGKGVLKAIKNVEKIISPALKGKDPAFQKEIDELMIELDGTDNKSKLGANAILPVSMAVCRAGANRYKKPLFKHVSELSSFEANLPSPSFLMIEGAKHAKNKLDFQEFMAIAKTGGFKERIEKGTEVYRVLGEILEKKYGNSGLAIGMEGGYGAAGLVKTKEVLDLISEAIENVGLKKEINLAIDCAVSIFYKNGTYSFEGNNLEKEELMDFYIRLCEKYPIISLEDPFSEEDEKGFELIMKEIGDRTTIIGDDLLATNPEKIKNAISEKLCNGMILKLNQIGTVTEAIEAAKIAKKAGWKIMVSHRSGETLDDFIADFSAGIGADFIKSGSMAKPERMTKYNRLVKIEEEITER